MPPKVPKLLEDIRDACAFIASITAGKSLDEFQADRVLYQAVERNFEIIGEAMGRLARTDVAIASRLGEYPQIISFRNLLIHGYDQVDPEVVWEVLRNDLPPLLQRVEALLNESGPA